MEELDSYIHKMVQRQGSYDDGNHAEVVIMRTNTESPTWNREVQEKFLEGKTLELKIPWRTELIKGGIWIREW